MILITGGAGFIGSNIVADLNERGRSNIVIADRLGTENKWRNLSKRRFNDFIFPSEIERFLSGCKGLSAVIHMGAISSTTAIDGDEVISSNFKLSTQLWNWCTVTQTPFIYASSAATYGDGSEGFVDTFSLPALERLAPLNLYGWSKHAFDKWVFDRSTEGSAPPQWAGLKFFNVYGPNEWHKGDMQSLASKLADPISIGQPIRLFKSHRDGYADGEQLRDFVYVRDCSSVILWLLEHRAVSGLFNLGTGKARSFRDLVVSMGEAFGRKVEIDYMEMPETIRGQYQYFTQADISKLRIAGYDRQFHSIEDGTRDYVTNFLLSKSRYR